MTLYHRSGAFLAAASMLLSVGTAYAASSGEQCAAELSAPVEFRISHQNSTTSPIHPRLLDVVKDVDAATKGKIKLNVFPSAQLGGEMQALEQASLGQNIIFYTTSGALATAGVPELSILNGPFLTETLASAQKLAQSELVKGWEDKLADEGGLRILALNWFDSPRSILSNKAYPQPGDLSGMKMRVPEAPAYVRTFTLLKTSPLPLPFSELYLALQQGVVNAVEGGIRGMDDAKLMEVAKTVTVTNHFRIFYGFAMNSERFEKLPKACQKVMTEQFNEKGDIYSAGMDKITEETVDSLKKRGVTFVDADIPAYKEATRGFYEMFPEWPKGLFEQVQAAIK
ncbi:TRAP transporter substrate-binding protein DctP [Microvirga lotononidis]|nr:TRAP transporter substrate-binding protein DctP [Microvirga lotononidis]WQO30747.1 TRAP transporter substrate-binding protein DctP [Microvirga lotononidis]